MGLRKDFGDLVTSSEIVERLGQKDGSVAFDRLRRHPDFPKPVIERPGVALWSWREVAAWAKRTGRL